MTTILIHSNYNLVEAQTCTPNSINIFPRSIFQHGVQRFQGFHQSTQGMRVASGSSWEVGIQQQRKGTLDMLKDGVSQNLGCFDLFFVNIALVLGWLSTWWSMISCRILNDDTMHLRSMVALTAILDRWYAEDTQRLSASLHLYIHMLHTIYTHI